MGQFFNERLKNLHKIPDTKIGMNQPSVVEAMRKEYNDANTPPPEPEPLLDVDDIEVKRARMAHAREVQKAKREARRVEATGSQT